MLDEIRERRSNRINLNGLSKLPAEMPEFPTVMVRREGLLGRPNAIDLGHVNRLRQIHHQAVEATFIEHGLCYVAVAGQDSITEAVARMEEREKRFLQGSLARECAEKVSELDAEALVLQHAAITQSYTQQCLARNRRGRE